MSLLFKDGAIKLVDHNNKTLSCDLYDLLLGDEANQFNNFDGEAIELANSETLEEN